MNTSSVTIQTYFIRFFQCVVFLSVITLVPAASAYDRHYANARENTDTRYADVVAVEPVFKEVRVEVPRRYCWEEEVYREKPSSRHRHHDDGVLGSTIAGGLIGGVIGRQIGSGSGRDAMTAVGAIVGSAIGNQRGRHYRNDHDDDYYEDVEEYEVVKRCETRRDVKIEEKLQGYRVTYVYDGREYTTRTRRDPGDKIQVRVTVTPSE